MVAWVCFEFRTSSARMRPSRIRHNDSLTPHATAAPHVAARHAVLARVPHKPRTRLPGLTGLDFMCQAI
jgi:hypothetical protein